MPRTKRNDRIQKPKPNMATRRSSRRIKQLLQSKIRREHKNIEVNTAEGVSTLEKGAGKEWVSNRRTKGGFEEFKDKHTKKDSDEVPERDSGDEVDDKIMTIIDEDIHKIELAGKYLVKLIREKIKLKKEYLPEKTYGFYDYRSWNPEWQTSLSSSDSIIKFMFGVTDDVPYYRKCFQLILDEVFNEMKKDKLLIQKFFKFYMSLPIFEYEYSAKPLQVRIRKITIHYRPAPLGIYGNSIGNFHNKLMKFNEDSCRKSVDIITRKLSIIAVNSLKVRIRDCRSILTVNENTILDNAYQLVIEPLCLLLQEISKVKCKLEFEQEEIYKELISDNKKYVDTSLYLRGKSEMLCLYEFKNFSILRENYLPDGTFNIGKLFEDESEKDIGSNEKALLKYLKQLELQMMCHRVDRGILTDSYTFIFVIIDLERFEKEIKGNLKEGADFKPRDFPIKYNVASYHSSGLTVREYLLDFNYHSLRTEKESKEIRKKVANLEKYYKLREEYIGDRRRYGEKRMKNERRNIYDSSVCTFGNGTDLLDLYAKQWNDIVLLSQGIFLEDVLNERNNTKEQEANFEKVVYDIPGSQSPEKFSIRPIAKLPTSQNTSYNVKPEYTDEIADIQCKYRLQLCKKGFGMHKNISLDSNDVKILKGGEMSKSHVYVIDSKHLVDFINESVTSEKIVIKVHNPDSNRFLFKSVRLENNIVKCTIDIRDSDHNLRITGCLKNYLTELKCHKILNKKIDLDSFKSEAYKKMYKQLEFNSVVYDQRNLNLLVLVDGFLSSSGFTNVFKYIENQPLPKDLATFKKAQKQLEIIHRAGYIHHDIAERNILYSKDEKVYIIDFSNASYEPDNKLAMEQDIYNLKCIFKEVSNK